MSELLELYGSAWWTAHRSRQGVEAILAASDVVVGLVESKSDRLVGFARCLTDGVYLALVLDVIVAPAWRGRGLGQRLLDELLAAPELERVESVELVCQPELVPFYRRWGFTEKVGRSPLMRRTSNPLLAPTEG